MLRKCTFLTGNSLRGYGTCVGDSGGPAVYLNEHGQRRYIQIGIIQGGDFSCSPIMPGIYIRIEEQSILRFIRMAILDITGNFSLVNMHVYKFQSDFARQIWYRQLSVKSLLILKRYHFQNL